MSQHKTKWKTITEAHKTRTPPHQQQLQAVSGWCHQCKSVTCLHQHGWYLHLKAPESRCYLHLTALYEPPNQPVQQLDFHHFHACEVSVRANGCKTLSRRQETKSWWARASLTLESAAGRSKRNCSFYCDFRWKQNDRKSNFWLSV